jgi:hypothetical protein
MQRSIADPDTNLGSIEQNAQPRRRLLSPAQLDAARVMNTAPGRARYLAGFGDAAPPDRRPRAAVVRIGQRRP